MGIDSGPLDRFWMSGTMHLFGHPLLKQKSAFPFLPFLSPTWTCLKDFPIIMSSHANRLRVRDIPKNWSLKMFLPALRLQQWWTTPDQREGSSWYLKVGSAESRASWSQWNSCSRDLRHRLSQGVEHNSLRRLLIVWWLGFLTSDTDWKWGDRQGFAAQVGRLAVVPESVVQAPGAIWHCLWFTYVLEIYKCVLHQQSQTAKNQPQHRYC